jgi:cytochrome c553
LVARAGCITCHGDSFSKPVDPSYPKIAGQHADYLYVALKAYKTTDREVIGRSNPVMGGVAKQFSNEDLQIIANYVGSLPSDLKTIQPSRFR